MSLTCVMLWSHVRMVSMGERVIPGAGQGTWWGGEAGHAHPPAPREFGLVLLDRKVALADLIMLTSPATQSFQHCKS